MHLHVNMRLSLPGSECSLNFSRTSVIHSIPKSVVFMIQDLYQLFLDRSPCNGQGLPVSAYMGDMNPKP
jgi:hypothetical protein